MLLQIKNLTLTIITILSTILLTSCKSNIYNSINHDNLEHKKYLSAKKKIKNKNYKDAIKELELLNKQHPLSIYSTDIYFNLIYAYYKSMDFPSTHKTIYNFIELNPQHPNLDYPLYIRGLINMELDKNSSIINKLFKLTRSNYNPMYANEAFNDFAELIQKHPNSQYTLDAYKRLIYLKNRIAEHELSIIKYYHTKKAYIAVINRCENMLRCFPDTQATRIALLYLHIAYKKLDLNNQADVLQNILLLNKNQIKTKK